MAKKNGISVADWEENEGNRGNASSQQFHLLAGQTKVWLKKMGSLSLTGKKTKEIEEMQVASNFTS